MADTATILAEGTQVAGHFFRADTRSLDQIQQDCDKPALFVGPGFVEVGIEIKTATTNQISQHGGQSGAQILSIYE